MLDHPHIGEAFRHACLRPIEDLFGPEDIAGWQAAIMGRCLSSYRYGGRHWALPLDAAAQVMALRPDLTGGEIPVTWSEVVALARTRPVALSVAGPHAFLSFLSMAAAFGAATSDAADPAELILRGAGLKALDLLATLYGLAPPMTLGLNPIGLLDLMARGDAVALIPLIYGYATYAAPAHGTPVAFHNAPRASAEGRPGSVLGGTGIGVSKRCPAAPAMVRHLGWLLSAEAQRGFIPSHNGQPSRSEAWRDEAVDRRWGGFYSQTAETLEAAVVRPRYDGYVAFQSRASALLREGLESGAAPARLLDALRDLYRRSRPEDAEP